VGERLRLGMATTFCTSGRREGCGRGWGIVAVEQAFRQVLHGRTKRGELDARDVHIHMQLKLNRS
jgi:hypothetical protein